MKREFLYVSFSVLLLMIVLAGCGATPAAMPTATETPITPTVSATPDPCASGQIETEVQKVHKHMREFDDAAILASNLPREQLSSSITNMQRIRREADDEPIPDCLANLKRYQVDHMNSVINTLIAFTRGTDQQTVDQGINIARRQHDQYTLELARLLGLTVVPAATAPASPSGTTAP